MGLLELKTDLKSLKYGHDRAGGGSSGQPYIQTNINTIDKGINQLRLTKFDDGLIRGGVVGSTNAALTDTIRIGKFLTDFPRGPLFITKQIGLQLSNPRLESKSNAGRKIESAVGPTRIYNLGINTLAQVPINHLGGHVVRHGFLPISDPSKYYEAVVTSNNSNGSNRLEKLVTKFQLGDNKANLTLDKNKIKILNNITGVLSQITKINIPTLKPTQLTIDSYIGGPSSVYGIGNTTINRTSFTEDKSRIDDAKKYSTQFAGKTRDDKGNPKEISFNLDRLLGASIHIPSVLQNITPINSGPISNDDNNIPINLNDEIASAMDRFKFPVRSSDLPPLKNESDIVNNGPSSYPNIDTSSFQQALSLPNLVYGKDYNYINEVVEKHTSSNILSPTNYGIYSTIISQQIHQHHSPNSNNKPVYKNTYNDTIILPSSWKKMTREVRVGSGRKDQINLTPIFSAAAGTYIDKVKINGVSHNINDLVKFRIQAINTDAPTQANWMIFRAYISSFSDNVEAAWNDIKYAGRGDKFYIYDGFSRKMSVSFKVAALSAEEMKPMYQKLNYLMSNLMPDYKDNLMRGPLMRMTIGNYIDGQLCKLDSISYTIPNDSSWEISLGSQKGELLELNLPHIIEVQLSFTPIGSQTRDENKIPKKSECTSNIAQNWNALTEIGVKEYIIPCDDTVVKDPPVIDPPIVDPPIVDPPVIDPQSTSPGLPDNKQSRINIPKYVLPSNVPDTTDVRTIPYDPKQYPKNRKFKGWGGGSFGGGGASGNFK